MTTPPTLTPLPAPTPGQTVGPFFGYALPYEDGPSLVRVGHPDAIRLHGHVLDGAGAPVPDALVEIWQADGLGRVVQEAGSLRRDPFGFTGWGRCATDGTGHYSFTTVVPGATDPGRAPFFAVAVLARGLLDRLLTRAYVSGDAAAEQLLLADPFLAGLPEDRRATLVTVPDAAGLVFDIRLQGDAETVFLTQPGH